MALHCKLLSALLSMILIDNYFRGPPEKWKCAVCENKILPPGNMLLHYEKYHSDIEGFHNILKVRTSLDQLTEVIEPKRLPRSNKTSLQSKLPKRFWPCSICGEKKIMKVLNFF